jgi:hypothetical protein
MRAEIVFEIDFGVAKGYPTSFHKKPAEFRRLEHSVPPKRPAARMAQNT